MLDLFGRVTMTITRIEERRRFERLNDRIFILCQFVKKKDVDIIKGFSNDVSAGGLCFETDRFISPQAIFSLEIYQPLRRSKEELINVSALAKVKWVRQTDIAGKYEGSNKYKIGVEFVKIDNRERKAIAEYVQDKLNI